MEFNRQTIRKINLRLITAAFVFSCLCGGCTSTPIAANSTKSDCLDEIVLRVREAPEKEYLHTLDGQYVKLDEFFDQCSENSPYCILFPKFYHWQNEVIQTISLMEDEPRAHKIRVYYNPLSVCHPERVHPERTHGDVAEFYNEEGKFMGIAVYMGQGQYFLLHYRGYQRLQTQP
jgi:hypothetical protein